jgi:peptidoglycan/LPS O-acetylase OafA/YrhL
MVGRHLAEIDGIRAIAVTAVIIFHYEHSALPFGYLGVDIFFAISGYVITSSIVSRLNAGVFTLNDFFMRRIKRLFPALALVVVTTIVLATLLLPKDASFITGSAALLGLSNIILWAAGLDYFATSAEWNPLTHTWSLSVEEQFYLFFPLLLLFLRGRPSATMTCLGLVGSISLAAYVAVWSSSPMVAFYLSPFRLWELIAGALVFYCHYVQRNASIHVPYRNVVMSIFMVVLLVILTGTWLSERSATLLSVATTCGLLYLSGVGRASNRLLLHPVLQVTGEISYSLYLWHWPVAIFTKLLVPTGLVLPVYVVTTAATAVLSYAAIERPLRYSSWKWSRERFLVALPTLAFGTACVIGVLWFARSALYLGPPTMLERSFLVESPCHIPDHKGLLNCLRSDRASSNTIWLLGDSHAGNFLLSLRTASERLGSGLQHLTGRSLFRSLADQCGVGDCPEGTAEDVVAHLGRIARPGDIVVMSFARDRFMREQDVTDRFRRSLDKLVGDLSKMRIHVVLVEDIPKVCKDDGEFFRSTLQTEACRVRLVQSRQERQILSDIYAYIAGRHGVTVIDPHDALCELRNAEPVCSSWLAGDFLYIDASPHLSRKTSEELSDFFYQGLRPLLSNRIAGDAQ